MNVSSDRFNSQRDPGRGPASTAPAAPGAPVTENVGQVRAATIVNVLLGAWLIASPWIFGYDGISMALWDSVIIGALIVIFAAARYATPLGGASWPSVVLGLWTIASPWVFGFVGAGRWNSVVLGIIVALLALWSERVLSPRAAAGTCVG